MRLLFVLVLLLAGWPGHAQPTTAPFDVLLLTNGDEIPGQVLTIGPHSISYRALNPPDTLRFDTDAVFLIRFANGTSEVLHGHPAGAPTAPLPDVLAGLSTAQRHALGQSDARHNYTNESSFWISAGGGLQGGPFGAVAPAVLTSRRLTDQKLHAPVPARLADPVYHAAYQQEARRIRRGKAWGGYALGASAWLLIISIASSSN